MRLLTDDYRSAVLRRFSLAVLALVLAATADASTRTDERRLDLVAFPGYAEAGGDDPRVNWVTPFVQKTGCKVHVLTGGHVVEPLDLTRIPNYREVFPALRRLPQNLDGAKVVGVPHGRGPNLLLWRTDLVRPAPRSWDVLYDHRYAGRIGLYDAAVGLAPTAIHLGLRSPYELGHAQFRRVVRTAADQSADAGFYWQDLTNALADYTGGNAIAGEASPRLAALLKADQVPVATALPPGSTARSVSWMLLVGARHPNCMYRWLDYIVSAKPNAASARYLHEAPATPAACGYMNCRAVHAADEPYWRRLSFWRTPQRDCHDRRGRACADWFDWSDA